MLDFSHALLVKVHYMYSTRPNGATLYTEKSQTFKNDCNPFLLFISHNEQLQNHCWPSAKSMTLNFVDVVSVLPPIFFGL